jgi:hypothetical protein
MNDFDRRTQAHLDFVLDEVCAELPNGGDHESRKFVAEQLMAAARAGERSLAELTYVGQRALVHLNQRSA